MPTADSGSIISPLGDENPWRLGARRSSGPGVGVGGQPGSPYRGIIVGMPASGPRESGREYCFDLDMANGSKINYAGLPKTRINTEFDV